MLLLVLKTLKLIYSIIINLVMVKKQRKPIKINIVDENEDDESEEEEVIEKKRP